MKTEILCVGTELLLGDIVNTNAAFIARELANLGIDVYYQTVVGDNNDRLKESLRHAFTRADTVIVTGGLGPTYDDLTKETVAEYFGRKMVRDEESLKRLTAFFKEVNVEMTENNKKQTMMPEGATVFQNEFGTAPGLALSDGEKTAILLPGPPREMVPMFRNSVAPYLMQFTDKVLLSRNIRLFGIGESAVEDMLHDLMTKSTNPTIAPYAKQYEVTLRLTAAGKTKEECAALLKPMETQIIDLLGDYIYGIDIESIEQALVLLLKGKKLKIATAESCTGGLISQRITSIAGSSSVFDCGICSYSNDIKHSVLGVSESTLVQHGAVSAETAAEMAACIRKISNADIGISVTGIAGPDGGTEEKPVGLVYIGIDSDVMTKTLKLNLSRRNNSDERSNIRHMAAQHAMVLSLKAAKLYPAR